MRAKTETRRQAILDAAAAVFQELGFKRATMSAICERLGYSKATLYNYFESKEALFSALVFDATEIEFDATLAALDDTLPDITAALTKFGRGMLTLLSSPQVQAVRRLITSDAGRSELSRQTYENGPKRREAATAAFLQRAMDAGKLRRADARIASLQLRALLEAEWLDRFEFKLVEPVDDAELEATVARAVSTFMAAYAPAAA